MGSLSSARVLSRLFLAFALCIVCLAAAIPSTAKPASPHPQELSDPGQGLYTHLSRLFDYLGVPVPDPDLVLVAYEVYGLRLTTSGVSPTTTLPVNTALPSVSPTTTLPASTTTLFDPFADPDWSGEPNIDWEVLALHDGDEAGPAVSPLEYASLVNKQFSSPAFSSANDVAYSFPAGASFVCPVAGPVRFINDWGFPRSRGRTHRGTDMFAPRHTPVVAVADARVLKVDRVDNYVVGTGKGDLGGLTIWIVDDHGTAYYYAHLESISESLAPGQRVSKGEFLGTLGNSGNAATTSPHLHFQVHPGGGDAINPYPIIWGPCAPTNNPPAP